MSKKKIFIILVVVGLVLLAVILASVLRQEQPDEVPSTSNPTTDNSLENLFDFQFEPDRENLPDRDAAQKVTENMSAHEVYSIMGKPQRDVGSGTFVLEWDLDSGEILKVSFILDVEKNDWYVVGSVII